MIAPDVCLISIDKLPTADWRLAGRFIHPMRGVVYVEMCPPMEMRGELHLPLAAMRGGDDQSQARHTRNLEALHEAMKACHRAKGEGAAAEKEAAEAYKRAKREAMETASSVDNDGDQRPDVGVVVAVGLGVSLYPGDVVAVRPTDGTWRWEFEAGSYRPENEVRVYGIYCDPSHRGDPEIVPWYDSIMAILSEAMHVAPTGDNYYIKRDAVVKDAGGVLLPESEWHSTNIGRVLARGPLATQVRVGQRVVYSPNSPVRFAFPGKDGDTCMVRESGIECLLEDEEAA